jgi:hypothetical protein
VTSFETQDVEFPSGSKADELLRAKEAIAGPVPLIPDQPSSVVTLPKGYLYQGAMQTKAEVRELTGADEERLARTKDFAEFFDRLAALGTARIGDVDLTEMSLSDRQGVVQTLLVGERERLVLAVVQATYGDTKTISFTCGQCAAEQEVDIIFSEDFTVRDVDDIRASYTLTTSTGDLLEYRLVNGADQMEALKDASSNMAEQNTIILSRCITKVNDGLVPDPLGYARQMKIKDRRAILKVMVEHQPGVDLEVKLHCVRCQNEQSLPLGWGDLFQT